MEEEVLKFDAIASRLGNMMVKGDQASFFHLQIATLFSVFLYTQQVEAMKMVLRWGRRMGMDDDEVLGILEGVFEAEKIDFRESELTLEELFRALLPPPMN